jgi:hypothetical protein
MVEPGYGGQATYTSQMKERSDMLIDIKAAYRLAMAQGTRSNRAVHQISRATGRPSSHIRRELGIR